MSTKRGGEKSLTSRDLTNQVSKGKTVFEPNTQVDESNQGVSDINLATSKDDDGGEWEVYARKSKNKLGGNSASSRVTQNSNVRAWTQSDASQKIGTRGHEGAGRASGTSWHTQAAEVKRPSGRGNARPQFSLNTYERNNVAPHPVIRPPLEHGWKSRPGSMLFKSLESVQDKNEPVYESTDKNGHDDNLPDDIDDDLDLEDSDDELLSDDYDSDVSQKSHETRKKSKWFKKFFDILDNLTIDQISEPERQWHCPACQGGPGAIDWYKGLQPLMTHAKTKGSNRVRIHREFAATLEEELRRKGTSVIPAGEMFGKWKGLKDEEKDHDIVWPPMVIIQNTQLERDENDMWIGMGSQELLDYFNTYPASKARHSYGPQGHRGMSVLIFEASARGYLEAERLDKHFADEGANRDAWEVRRRGLFLPGGKRLLYGYMAKKADLDAFNRHSQGKSRLKYEMRSYQEMVVKQIRQMSEDNQQLTYFKNKVVREIEHAKALEESFGIVTEKLRKTMEENRLVRERIKLQHEENREEMYLQEQYFKDQIRIIHDSMYAKEENFVRLQQEKQEKVPPSNVNPSNAEEFSRKAEELLRLKELQVKELEEFAAERDQLLNAYKDKINAMKLRHFEEEVGLEKEYDCKLTKLMEKFSPAA